MSLVPLKHHSPSCNVIMLYLVSLSHSVAEQYEEDHLQVRRVTGERDRDRERVGEGEGENERERGEGGRKRERGEERERGRERERGGERGGGGCTIV